mmetsp:Transcript_25081/g.72403  ORF Transcript_25081/g.72403 Transcript_25081/m.72403 type:complete len:81 (-) Transcript_25081:232-474(-)
MMHTHTCSSIAVQESPALSLAFIVDKHDVYTHAHTYNECDPPPASPPHFVDPSPFLLLSLSLSLPCQVEANSLSPDPKQC